jgi:hypothetical protein
MGVGKYSPTVSRSYMVDRDWWRKAAKDGAADPDGYDAYGYSQNGEGPDRAGNSGLEYIQQWNEESGFYLYEQTAREWSAKVISFKRGKADDSESAANADGQTYGAG